MVLDLLLFILLFADNFVSLHTIVPSTLLIRTTHQRGSSILAHLWLEGVWGLVCQRRISSPFFKGAYHIRTYSFRYSIIPDCYRILRLKKSLRRVLNSILKRCLSYYPRDSVVTEVLIKLSTSCFIM